MTTLKEYLDGKKTYIGGAGFILVAVGTAMIAFYEGTPIDWKALAEEFFAGVTIIGGRSAIAKIGK